ncbi:MAG: hypothetical protein AAFV69_08935 [Pseudomonadota bacterium]
MFFEPGEDRRQSDGHRDHLKDIEQTRARSARTVGIVYCALALGCAAAALFFQHSATEYGLPPGDAQTVSSAFAAIGSTNLVLLTVWERLFCFSDA